MRGVLLQRGRIQDGAETPESCREFPEDRQRRFAVEAAERGVEATARMKARLGRSSYLGDRVLGCPDPGVKVVAVWLRAASEALFGV